MANPKLPSCLHGSSLMEISAHIGHYLHFSFLDMLEMTADEMQRFFKICESMRPKG